MKKYLLLFLLTTLPVAHAVKDENYFHAFVGLGELYNPSSYRIGHKQWEFGQLNRQSFGLVKLFHKGSIYAGFGPAYVKGFGFYGAMGFELPFWSVFTLRGELNGTNSFSNFAHGDALLGLTFYL